MEISTNESTRNVLKPNEGASKQNSPEEKYKNIKKIDFIIDKYYYKKEEDFKPRFEKFSIKIDGKINWKK